MAKRQILRVGIVGCGIISEAHIRAYQQHAGRARITVCCDVDIVRAKQRAELAGGARAVCRFEDVLADPDVDAVEILTPHQFHADQVIAAARAGKHILCQKPLARTLEECDAMAVAAREAGVVLFYGEMNQTRPAVVAARRAIDDGLIGRLVGLQATYAQWQGGQYMSTPWRYDPEIAGGGELADGGIHFINMIAQVGGPIEAVNCITTRFREELGGEDTATVNFRFAAGHLGVLFSSHAVGLWPPTPEMVVFGTEGLLVLGHGKLTLHRRDLSERSKVLLEGHNDPFTLMVGHYLDTVLDGAPSVSPPEVGRENLRIVLAAYQSAKAKREVSLCELG